MQKRKKILLVTQYFFPESFRGNDIAFELNRRGYDVTVLTGIPNYPTGRFFEGYGYFKRRRENIDGVKVIRTFLFPRGNSHGISLILNYLSWLISSTFYGFFLGLTTKYDKIIVQQLSPVTVGIPAVIISKLSKTPIYFWVLDLWPESLLSGGGTNNKFIISFLNKVVSFLYKSSHKILISSKGFKKSILEKADCVDNIIYFPNWAEDSFVNELVQEDIPLLPSGFNIMFAGNIGEAQDVDTILEAAVQLKSHSNINFLFVGDGRKVEYMKDFIRVNNLSNVYLLGRFPIQYMPSFFSKADVMLVSLKDDPIMNLTVPAKIQAYMSVGKPILAMLNGEGSDLIKEVNCGYTVLASSSLHLTKKILEISNLDQNELSRLGQNGKDYFDKYFTMTNCINNLEDILKD